MTRPGNDSAGRADALRQVARHFPTGVTVVALGEGSSVHAMTANSFITLSLDPPLIGVAVRSDGRFCQEVRRRHWFGVSILAASQRDYATFYADPDRYRILERKPLALTSTPFPVPLVPDCLGYFVCEVRSIQRVGDHDLIIGGVWSCGESVDTAAGPLMFLDGIIQASPTTTDVLSSR
jgi:flavin reductase